MKYIFVDFDGVLTSMDFQLKHGFGRLDPATVAILSDLVRQTDARIVVTSSWRTTVTDMRRLFKQAGFKGVGKWVIDITPIGLTRGHGIRQWMICHRSIERDDVVILDDEEIDLVLLPRLVRTDYQAGLTVEDARRAVQLLSAAKPEEK